MADIKAVLFDVGGVLTSSPFSAILEYEKEKQLGDGFFRRVLVKGQAFRDLESGKLSVRDFVREFERECEGKLDAADWLAHLGRSMLPRQAFKEAVLEMKASGRLVGIITNNWQGTLRNLLPW